MTLQRLTIVARTNVFTGYGELLLQVFAGLEYRGIHCSIRSLHTDERFAPIPLEVKDRLVDSPQPEPIELLISPPSQLPTPGKKTVYFTMFEKTWLRPEYVKMLNMAAHVVVPCEWCRKHFVACGVTVPVSVIPLGHCPDIFSYVPPIEDDVCVFGAAGRLEGNPIRKGVGRVIDVFQKTFGPEVFDVRLRVKVHPDCKLPEVNDPRIQITREHLPWHEVRKWFSSLTAFISLASSEGFGLWQIQSMAMGRPIIAVRYSGMEEYHTDESGYVIPHHEAPLPAPGCPGDWAHFSDEDVSAILKRVYADRKEAKKKGVNASKVAQSFTWDRTLDALHKLISEVPIEGVQAVPVQRQNEITLFGHVETFSGYGQALCEVFHGLERRGVNCMIKSRPLDTLFGATVPQKMKERLVPRGQSPWELMLVNPMYSSTPGKKVIRYTMWETTRLPSEWVQQLNKAELVIVPSTWNKESFIENGVKTPIKVVPLGYDPSVFTPLPIRRDKFVFGVAGRISHGPERKGVGRAIELFQRRFENVDDVELHVKVHPDCKLPTITDSRIKITAEHLDWQGVMRWFHKISCFLSLATAEGFGLWQIQAMACGRPLIASRFSAMADYHSDETGYVIPHSMVTAEGMGGQWAAMSDDDIVEAMMESRGNNFLEKGKLAADRARAFTWDGCVEKLFGALKDVGAIQ